MLARATFKPIAERVFAEIEAEVTRQIGGFLAVSGCWLCPREYVLAHLPRLCLDATNAGLTEPQFERQLWELLSQSAKLRTPIPHATPAHERRPAFYPRETRVPGELQPDVTVWGGRHGKRERGTRSAGRSVQSTARRACSAAARAPAGGL